MRIDISMLELDNSIVKIEILKMEINISATERDFNYRKKLSRPKYLFFYNINRYFH